MNVYTEGLLVQMGINILLALSVYAPLMTDQLSVGNAGFMAIGAYLSAYLTVISGLPLIPALIVGSMGASAIGILIGIPALRLKGLFLVMATLGFGEMVRTFFLIFEPTGGASGFRGPMGTTLILVYACVVLVIGVFWLIHRSRLGRSLDAIRDDQEVAGAMGMNVTALKVASFGLGAFVAGLAGGLHAHHMFYIESSEFNFVLSTMIVLYVILGGMEIFWGAVLGAIIFSLLPEIFRFMAEWRMTVYGGILVLLMIVRPQGLITRRMYRAFTHWLAGLFGRAEA
jgi:branched-chain amino acid transport system permease protein